jgi:GTP-dependent phosphoenolpyruvate carboxykinase
LRVDRQAWLAELPDIERHFARFGERLPMGVTEQVRRLRERLEMEE